MKRKFTLFYKWFLPSIVVLLLGLQGNAQVIAQIGAGTNVIGGAYGNSSPISNYYKSSHTQIIYTKAAIDAAITTAGGTINVAQLIDSLAWDVTTPGTYALPAYTIKMKNTSATSAATYDAAGLITVYTATSYAPVANSFNDFLAFQTSFFWDGNSNILIDICYDVASGWSSNGKVNATTATTDVSKFVEADGSNQCGIATDLTSNKRPNIKLSFSTAPVCTNPPTAGTTSIVDSICPNVPLNLNATGTSSGAAGLAYQWQQATVAAGPFTDIAGAITLSYTIAGGITSNTYYRLKTSCSGGTAVYTPAKLVTIKSVIDCYCTPSTTNNYYYINDFSTTGGSTNISNLSSGYSTNGYGDFSATQNVTQVQGASFDFSSSFSGSSHGAKIWIDWNQNGVFTDPGEQVYATTSYVYTISGTITIPATATAGVTRMRIGANESSSTGPSGPCANFSYGEYEDYKVTIIPPPPCNTLATPTNVHTIAFPGNLCVSGNVDLSIDSTMPAATGLTYQWESSPNGTTWTNIAGATAVTYTATAVSSTTYYRLVVKCNSSAWFTSAVDTVVVSNPGTLTGTSGTRCGPGQVALSATPSIAGTPINWYADATGGIPLATGQNFTTPYIPTTTNFYAAAAAGSSAATVQIGTGTSSSGSTDPGPFNNFYRRYTMQIMYTNAEIIAAGGGVGVINSLAFNCTGLPANAMPDYTVSIALVSPTMTTLAWQPATAFTQVYTTASYLPAATGWQNINFTSPIPYDGASNIVVQVCWSQIQPAYNSSGEHQYTSVTGRMLYNRTDDPGSSCGDVGASTSSYVPNVKFGMVLGCESPRVAVAANITAGPALTKNYPGVICNNTPAQVSVTPATAYTPYKWYPVTDLYTNAAGTVPYTGGSASTVYFKSTVSGEHTFYAIGGDTAVGATSCSHADTFKIWVQPGDITISGFPDTICESGTTTLSMHPDTAYYPGSIQWQTSPNGTTYTNIAGANGVTYTTPTLTNNTYYKVVVNAGNNVCEQPTKVAVVAHPQFISKTDSARCGPGVVTLLANTGGNSTPVWYDTAVNGMPVGTGFTFTTPYLTQTDTFYVVAGGGTVAGTVSIGSGTSISSYSGVSPFYHSYGGYKHQFLIKASELAAAGLLPGSHIKSLAFEMATAGNTYNSLAISMGSTTLADLPTGSWQPVSQVKAPANHTTVMGFNGVMPFDVDFVWDGTSNVIVQTCWSNNNYGGTTNDVVYHTTTNYSTHYGYQDNQTPATICNNPTYDSRLTRRPNMKLGFLNSCESTPRNMVIATVNPLPEPDLGPDIDSCIDQGSTITLNPGTLPNSPTFVWDDNSTSNTRDVNTTGNYSVTVTNSYGCVTSDTVAVHMKWNPEVDLAAFGPYLCIGGTKVLDAGSDGQNGGNYYWNTGAVTQTIEVTNAGTYIVYVTSPEGCLTIDTTVITTNGNMPSIDAIVTQPQNNPYNFTFTALNPQYISTYEWEFGDGSAPVTTTVPNTSHTYPSTGDYIVKLKVYSICGDVVDSSTVHVLGSTGINDLGNDSKYIEVYPNPNDGNIVFIESKGDIKVKEIVVYNAIGQQIIKVDEFNSSNKHKIELPANIASGVYNIRINTNKGLTTKKLQIVK